MADIRVLTEKAPWLLTTKDGFCDGRYQRGTTLAKVYVPVKTVPKSPKLITKERLGAKRSFKQKEEASQPPKKKFRARKDENGKVIVEEFNLSKSRNKPVVQEVVKPFKAKPMPDLSKKPVYVKQKKKTPTKIEAFTLQTDARGSKQEIKAKVICKQPPFKALPMPDFTQKVTHDREKSKAKITVPIPFKMEERKKFNISNTKVKEEEDRSFKALPLPNFEKTKFVISKSTRQPTKPKLNKLPTELRAEKSSRVWEALRSKAFTNVEAKRKEMIEKEELRDQKALEEVKIDPFKARPSPDFKVAHEQEMMRLKKTVRKVELTIPLSPFVHRKNGTTSIGNDPSTEASVVVSSELSKDKVSEHGVLAGGGYVKDVRVRSCTEKRDDVKKLAGGVYVKDGTV